jgi:hypothetical protein
VNTNRRPAPSTVAPQPAMPIIGLGSEARRKPDTHSRRKDDRCHAASFRPSRVSRSDVAIGTSGSAAAPAPASSITTRRRMTGLRWMRTLRGWPIKTTATPSGRAARACRSSSGTGQAVGRARLLASAHDRYMPITRRRWRRPGGRRDDMTVHGQATTSVRLAHRRDARDESSPPLVRSHGSVAIPCLSPRARGGRAAVQNWLAGSVPVCACETGVGVFSMSGSAVRARIGW